MPALLEVSLSMATIVAVGYHAALVTHQKLSFFHTVRYLLSFSYILFGGVVATELSLANTSDTAIASLLFRTEISLVIIASVLLAIVANVLVLQAHGEEFPYRRIIERLPLSLALNLVVNAATFILVWGVFEFKFEVGTKAILGTSAFIPRLDTLQFTTLALVFAGFVWNQSKLVLRGNLATQPESLFEVIRATGLLWITMATVLFVFNGALRTIRIDLVQFGHLLDLVLLSYAAYVYAKPTALLEFFASDLPLAVQLKHQQFPTFFNPLGSRLNIPHRDLQGKRLYLFAEPSQNLAPIVEDFLDEAVTNAHQTLVILHAAHSLAAASRAGVSIIVMSLEAKSAVTGENQIVVPINKQDIVLDIVRKALNIRRDLWIIFPNLSSLIAHWGFPSSYVFLQHLSELLGREGFLLGVIFSAMHSPQDVERIWLLGQPLTERSGKIYYLRSSDTGFESPTLKR